MNIKDIEEEELLKLFRLYMKEPEIRWEDEQNKLKEYLQEELYIELSNKIGIDQTDIHNATIRATKRSYEWVRLFDSFEGFLERKHDKYS